MNFITSGKQPRLELLIVLLAGLFLANALWSQETVLFRHDAESGESEICGPLRRATTVSRETHSRFPAGQIVITHHTWGRVEPVRICPEDDIWLVSARRAHCAPSDLSLLRCSRLRNENWETAELDDLFHSHSSDRTKVTTVYVHGNLTNLKWAKSRGLQFYKTAFQADQRPPLRFVIFAWRSDQEKVRAIVDYEIKSKRSVVIGETFGRLLEKFEDRWIVISGFSLGAQVVFSALSMPELQNGDDRVGKYRVAVFAPVFNSDFVESELIKYVHNPIVHRTELFLNHSDRAIKLSQWVAVMRAKSKFSLTELANGDKMNNGVVAGKLIKIRDITNETSNKHSIESYSVSNLLKQELAESLNATLDSHATIVR